MIDLSPCDMLLARHVAAMRMVQNIRRGVKDKHGAERENADAITIQGCLGEIAVAKALNLFWSGGVGVYRVPDVGGAVDVRTVVGASRRLIVHREDPDDRPFVLARLIRPDRVELAGWIMGSAAKRQEWWQDPTGDGRAAYFVPNDALGPIDKLRAMPGILPRSVA